MGFPPATSRTGFSTWETGEALETGSDLGLGVEPHVRGIADEPVFWGSRWNYLEVERGFGFKDGGVFQSNLFAKFAFWFLSGFFLNQLRVRNETLGS